ncbi:MAG TPA: aminotransferase class V-fold PLP-dependent enzyme [Kofleriaceae bacterium]
MKPETIAAKAVHVDRATGAIVPPIHLSTTYARDASGALPGPMYTRDENPGYAPVEHTIAQLDGGAAALLFASGMTATTAAFRALCSPGDHIVAPNVGYFAVRKWLKQFARWGVTTDFVDMTDLAAVKAALRSNTKIVWLESPSNPTWAISDITAIAELAHAVGAVVAVDATAASPVHVHPIALGADLVMHSATKYLAGHSDVLAGVLVTARIDDRWAALKDLRYTEGPVLGPMETYLLQRGMRTLFARVERSSATAANLAERLSALPGVTVRYPGLSSHPQHAIAVRQYQRGFGSMMSIQVGSRERAIAATTRVRCWLAATSLGGVESLIEHRASVEGPDTPTPVDLLRLSIGMEHVDDLFTDLAQALA